jgi:hypothetical protein
LVDDDRCVDVFSCTNMLQLSGVQLTRAILAASNETILCVCYTNHALDSFLEELLDDGLSKDEIIRIGGRSKNERVMERGLFEVARSGGRAQRSKATSKRICELYRTIEDAEAVIGRLQPCCKNTSLTAKSWNSELVDFLRFSYPADFKQLHFKIVDEDGFQRTVAADHLWKRWHNGLPPGVGFEDRTREPLWTMTKPERLNRISIWQLELHEDDRTRIMACMDIIRETKETIRMVADETQFEILSSARVIGCTTSGAAKYHHLLKEVNAGVVLIEEAGEIMEAHVLACLSKDCKQLIMIGDHKQLRPKAENFSLTLEANNGCDINRSLFERLACTVGVSTLTTQWRMHPDIAAIPRLLTYPKLIDAEVKVKAYPEVWGLPKGRSRTVFIDHRHPEDARRQVVGADKVDSVSKTSSHEVGMVVAIVRYLRNQGYNPKDLVVLTPYLGQLLHIKKALAADKHHVAIGEADWNEAKQHLEGVAGFTVGGEKAAALAKLDAGGESVRVATVDNYQGEESDIVITSLVRSTELGRSIGFLREPERVNVMLSRAKHCQIIIGNSECLQNAPRFRGSNGMGGGPLWTEIFKHLVMTNAVYPGLPVCCETHDPHTAKYIASPAEFAEHCPRGGCRLKCGQVHARCGHPCDAVCHGARPKECSIPCSVKFPAKCPAHGHSLRRPCWSESPPKCTRLMPWTCEEGHDNLVACHKEAAPGPCRTCIKIEEAETQLKELAEDAAKENVGGNLDVLSLERIFACKTLYLLCCVRARAHVCVCVTRRLTIVSFWHHFNHRLIGWRRLLSMTSRLQRGRRRPSKIRGSLK